MAHSKSITAVEARQLQEQNGVPPKLRGPWYHVSKQKELAQFRDDHEDPWVFFTRSPGGGTNWGDRVLEVFVVEPTTTHRFFATSNKGDKEGWDGDRPLQDWWLAINPAESGKLAVTGTLHLTNDAAKLEAIRQTEEYKARRLAAGTSPNQ